MNGINSPITIVDSSHQEGGRNLTLVSLQVNGSQEGWITTNHLSSPLVAEEKNVVNLFGHWLEENTIGLLEHGLGFVIAPRKIPLDDIIFSIEIISSIFSMKL